MSKKAIVPLITGLLLLTTTPVKADQFEDLLKQGLTPEEIKIYQRRGNNNATELAKQTCQSLDGGNSLNEIATKVAQSLAKEGLSEQQLEAVAMYSGKIIAFGVAAFCPQHLSVLEDLQTQPSTPRK